MKKILIGSKAIEYHFSDYFRESKDTDYAITGGDNFRKDD